MEYFGHFYWSLLVTKSREKLSTNQISAKTVLAGKIFSEICVWLTRICIFPVVFSVLIDFVFLAPTVLLFVGPYCIFGTNRYFICVFLVKPESLRPKYNLPPLKNWKKCTAWCVALWKLTYRGKGKLGIVPEVCFSGERHLSRTAFFCTWTGRATFWRLFVCTQSICLI